ncbi:ABC transporter permease [bacterium]|nr:ABC transporter permease [bacterium]
MAEMGALWFAIGEAVKSFWRHRFVAMLSIITIAGALFVLGFFITITLNLHSVLAGVQEKIAVELFLKDNITKVQVSSLMDEISKIEGVREVEFITKADAMKRFTDRFGQKYLVGLEENPFPPSILVKLEPGTKLDQTVKRIVDKYRGHKFITQISAPGKVARKLSNALKIFLILSAIWAVILFFGAIIIIVNTLKLAIYSRKESIEIMKLVGATDSFIHLPFMIEGSLNGALAGGLASVVLYLALTGMKKIIPALQMPPDALYYGIVLLGIALGVLGSRLAVKRFL